MFYNILSQIFIVKCFTKSLLIRISRVLPNNYFDTILIFIFFSQSLITVGAIFGSPLAGWAIDKLGRKSTIMLCVVPFVLGWLLIGFAQNLAMLYSGRVISGLACGVISVTAPVSSILSQASACR